ncbi:hypothetical protein EX30DRAFT_336599, partial [Ascodesmis nigricans]
LSRALLGYRSSPPPPFLALILLLFDSPHRRLPICHRPPCHSLAAVPNHPPPLTRCPSSRNAPPALPACYPRIPDHPSSPCPQPAPGVQSLCKSLPIP